MRWSFALLALLLTVGCEDDEVRLSVELRTDLVAGVDFVGVRVEVEDFSDETLSPFGTDFSEGRRVADVESLAPGDVDVLVSLLDASGAVVASRLQRLQLTTDYVAIALITRDCRGVVCPGTGDPANFLTCVGGVCTDPACSELDEASCTAECAVAADCAPLDPCAPPSCELGACVYLPDDGACGAGEYCDPEAGCTPAPMLDAGVPDAGLPDAGATDAGFDGGVDAGPGVPSLRAASITAGGGHACAIGTTGELYCWGWSSSRQLGLPTPTNQPIPVEVSIPAVDQVEAYFAHTCVRRAGVVQCFGRGEDFQLGVDLGAGVLFDDTPQTPFLPTTAASLPPGDGTAVLLSDDTAIAWGPNAAGQLGVGTMGSPQLPDEQVDIMEAVTRVSIGSDHGCALGVSGTVYCWGNGGAGQLGDGTTTSRSSPAPVSAEPDGTTLLAVGALHTCLRRADGLWCFGSNFFGQLGTTAMSPVTNGMRVAIPVPDEICAGADHTCARLGGGVTCFGSNAFGELGRGTISPSESTPAPVVGLSDAVELACGKHFVCARRATDEVVCWGEGVHGQLGNGAAVNEPTPQLVLEPL